MGNDELARSGFEAFLRGDWDALAEIMDPDVEWLWHEPGEWDCHDRTKVLATLFDRQREGVVAGLNNVVAVDDRVGEDQIGRGMVRSWTPLEFAGRAGLILSHARRALRELSDEDPPLVWGDVDAGTGLELWWLLPAGLNELDRLQAAEGC